MLNKIALSLCLVLFFIQCQEAETQETPSIKTDSLTTDKVQDIAPKPIIVGAARYDQYASEIEGKNIAMVVNQTSMVGDEHLVDVLLGKGIAIKKIFAPEHGFRGKADAGASIKDGKDSKTGLPIKSLYGKNKKPSAADLKDIDVVIFDIQDVGARFYTYISTMAYVMEACADYEKTVIVLDRPNPNGHYVDGPILEKSQKSFVGMHTIPTVHGMTIGEYAHMLNGEYWLENGLECDLVVVKCENYDHKTFYELPVKPSPNLPNIRSIYLYPSLCFFEGTVVSVGRGTDTPFQIYGHPKHTAGNYEFTPRPTSGASKPKHNGKGCNGYSMLDVSLEDLRNEKRLNLSYLIDFYNAYPNKKGFFNNFFKKLAGTTKLQQQIESGMSEDEIRATWVEGLDKFKAIRKQYLLYSDFE
jgi:uncharacterized protein YbbC (DUF1343 family)